jgi:kynurenine formamidase
MRRIIDLTHPIQESMPVIPGDPAPEIRHDLTLEHDGCSVQSVRFTNHVGTHLDAPSHFVPDATAIDGISPEILVGPAVLVDFTHKGWDERIDREDLVAGLQGSATPERLFLKTGWDARFWSREYFHGFPALTLEGANYLASLGIGLLGMDTPSPSPLDDPGQSIHMALLGAGTVLLESAANLTRIPGPVFELIALPLPLESCSGSPCRALAVTGAGA